VADYTCDGAGDEKIGNFGRFYVGSRTFLPENKVKFSAL